MFYNCDDNIVFDALLKDYFRVIPVIYCQMLLTPTFTIILRLSISYVTFSFVLRT